MHRRQSSFRCGPYYNYSYWPTLDNALWRIGDGRLALQVVDGIPTRITLYEHLIRGDDLAFYEDYQLNCT